MVNVQKNQAKIKELNKKQTKFTLGLEEKRFKKYLQEIEDPNYQGLVSQGLPKNPTPIEKAKYEVCQNIIRYKRVNSLSTEKLAKKIHLTSGETEEILYCYIDNFTLDRLANYASQLFKPLEIKVQV